MHTNCSVTISQTIPGAIVYPESLTGFINQTTDLIVSDSGQLFYHIYGEQFITLEDSICPCCKTTMHVHGQITRVLKHESKGNSTCRIFVRLLDSNAQNAIKPMCNRSLMNAPITE